MASLKLYRAHGGEFETLPGAPAGVAAFGKAFVDTGSPYLIIPPGKFHSHLKVYHDHGPKPFSSYTKIVLQPFVEVGLHFLMETPQLPYQPEGFVRVKAFLLEPHYKGKAVVIGLDTISQFALYLPPEPHTPFLLE